MYRVFPEKQQPVSFHKGNKKSFKGKLCHQCWSTYIFKTIPLNFSTFGPLVTSDSVYRAHCSMTVKWMWWKSETCTNRATEPPSSSPYIFPPPCSQLPLLFFPSLILHPPLNDSFHPFFFLQIPYLLQKTCVILPLLILLVVAAALSLGSIPRE